MVDTKNDGKNAIGLLKQRDGGRATFLPLDTIRGRSLRENGLENEYGFVGVASDLVRCDARYDSVIANLLGATVVVEDLDCGIQMAKRHDNRFRIVTLDGQVINAGGSMTGGSVSRNAGILSRAGELEQLEKKRKKLQSQLQDVSLMAESANRELQKAQYELEVARDRLQMAAFLQYTLPGSPSLYYGDEALMEGYKDPFNRRTYPWGREDTELVRFFRQLGQLRRDIPALGKGTITFQTAMDKHLAYTRCYEGQKFSVYVNRSGDPWQVPAGKVRMGKNLDTVARDQLILSPHGFCIVEA